MTRTISIQELQAHAAELLGQLPPNDELIVEQQGKPLAKISPVSSPPPTARRLGSARGQIWIAPNFDAPDPELEDLFYNGPIEPDASSSGPTPEAAP